MDDSAEGEHHHPVAGLYHGVAAHEVADAVAYQSGNGHVSGQAQVLDGGAGYLRALLGHDLGHLGVGHGEALGRGCVAVEHHLEDARRCQQLLVDDGADVEPLGLGYELEILDLGDGLCHAELLGREAGEDVALARIGYGYESIGVRNAGIAQHVGVAGVGIDDEGVGTPLGQLDAGVAVGVYDLEPELVAGHAAELYGYAAAAHDDDVAYRALDLAAQLDQHVHMLARGHEVDDVVALEAVVAAGDDGLAVTLDGGDVKVVRGTSQLFELHVYERRALPELDAHQNELPLVELEPVARPVVVECGDDLERGEVFGIYDVVGPYRGEERAVGRVLELIVVYSGHGLGCAEALGYGAGHDIARLERRDGYEQVAVLDAGRLEVAERRWPALNGEQVVVGVEHGELVAVLVEDGDVLLLARQELGEV